jgi:hypothetical protein
LLKKTALIAAAVILLAFSLSRTVWPVAFSAKAIGEPGSCDAAIWSRLYTPSRFRRPIIYDYPCVTIQGPVMEIDQPQVGGDGDYGFMLLNEKTGKEIHVEIVCAHQPWEGHSAAVQACRGYQNKVTERPTHGQRIRVTGWWVIDKGHNFLDFHQEIHPVSALTILPN